MASALPHGVRPTNKPWNVLLCEVLEAAGFTDHLLGRKTRASVRKVKSWKSGAALPTKQEWNRITLSVPTMCAFRPPWPEDTHVEGEDLEELPIDEEEEEVHKTFHQALAFYRQKEQLTQAEVEDLILVPPSHVGLYELGFTMPTEDAYKKLCELFPALSSAPKPERFEEPAPPPPPSPPPAPPKFEDLGKPAAAATVIPAMVVQPKTNEVEQGTTIRLPAVTREGRLPSDMEMSVAVAQDLPRDIRRAEGVPKLRTFGEAVRWWRQASPLDLPDFAPLLGISASELGRMEADLPIFRESYEKLIEKVPTFGEIDMKPIFLEPPPPPPSKITVTGGDPRKRRSSKPDPQPPSTRMSSPPSLRVVPPEPVVPRPPERLRPVATPFEEGLNKLVEQLRSSNRLIGGSDMISFVIDIVPSNNTISYAAIVLDNEKKTEVRSKLCDQPGKAVVELKNAYKSRLLDESAKLREQKQKRLEDEERRLAEEARRLAEEKKRLAEEAEKEVELRKRLFEDD